VRNYELILSNFDEQFGERDVGSITQETVLAFLTDFTERNKQSTKRLRYSLLSAFFNFIKNSFDPAFQNPCDTLILRKIFKEPKSFPWDILEKDVVDEIIFRTVNPRNRIMLELMARAGMRIGEVLKMSPVNIQERKITIIGPKSGKEAEVVYIPQKVADRLKDYIREKGIKPDKRIFPISYPAARVVVKNAGKLVGIDLKPHDLRRHAATFASRSGTPLEIVSKIILRHANLTITQIYLGKISEAEAIRWIDNLYG
jgi:integrase